MAVILFVCTGNSCRSPMAERLARLRFPQHRWESAGVAPAGGMHPLAQRVVAERGGDAGGFDSRSLSDLDLAQYGHVVLIGDSAQRRCQPCPPGVARHEWDIADPIDAEGSEEERLQTYRRAADALEEKIAELVELIDSPE